MNSALQSDPAGLWAGLCWLKSWLFQGMPDSDWADEIKAEWALQPGEMSGISKPKSTKPRSETGWVTLYVNHSHPDNLLPLRCCWEGWPTRAGQSRRRPWWRRRTLARSRRTRCSGCWPGWDQSWGWRLGWATPSGRYRQSSILFLASGTVYRVTYQVGQNLRWHQNKSSVLVWGPVLKCHLLFGVNGRFGPRWCVTLYRATLVVADLGWVDLNIDVPLPAKFCEGRWELGRTGYAARQDDGASTSKSTQPRSETTSVTLYVNWVYELLTR